MNVDKPVHEGGSAELRTEIARLERRIEREKRARLQAEKIADAGLRSLYEANQALDTRILERTAELHHALKVAEAANNAKSSFLGQMSHQVNTPLNGLLGMLELLTNEVAHPQAIEWHASATRSAQRLERLTKRLITYVEIENVDLAAASEPRSLGEMLNEVHDRWNTPCLHAAQLLSVELRPGADVLLPGCEELDLLFDELLSNVVEHALPGAVTVIGRLNSAGSAALIEVRDPGPGINPGLIGELHNLSAAPNQTQLGDAKANLGLALIDRIVRGLGGYWELLDDARPGVVLRFPIVAERPTSWAR